MKKIIFTVLLFTASLVLFGQNQLNVFLTFGEFKDNKPSMNLNFKMEIRTESDVYMTGGITNYRVKKVVPSTEKDRMIKEVWGVLVNDTVYINSYPYAGMFGYDKVIEKGYYSYFIAQPSYFKEKQVELGIINKGDNVKQVCCRTSYVIKPDGTVKWLNPDLLKELIYDDKVLLEELESKKINPDNFYEMFDLLRRYNLNK